MSNLKLTIAYDGTKFHGWQKTDMGQSVEGVLSEVLKTIVRHPVNLQAASRTDAGVHAEGQVVNFILEKENLNFGQLRLSLNQLLPSTISVVDLEQVLDSFHPTVDAKAKIYRYSVSLGSFQIPQHRLYSWHFPYGVNIELMQQASPVLIGRHDFAAFTNVNLQPPTETVRELYRIEFIKEKNQLVIEVEGNRFLFRMVRNLVGTLLYIGCGKLDHDRLSEILNRRDRRLAGVTAPPHGLSLHKILY